MIKNKTVIISCAGMGKRLGEGIPKALVKINGKTLLQRTLELLNDVEDVRIVVGYCAQDVILEAQKYRDDITFVFNHEYAINGTGASVALAAKYAREFILTIDGDVIVHPDDMPKIIFANEEFVGGCEISTDEPVFLKTCNDEVLSFSRECGEYEWTGITLLKTARVQYTDGHVYGLIEPFLPMKYKILRMKEIDTKNDYNVALKWVSNNYE